MQNRIFLAFFQVLSRQLSWFDEKVWYLFITTSKKGYRQNYIHVTELNGCNLNEDIFEKIIDYDKDDVMLWHGKRCESSPYSDDEINELEELLKEFK